LPIYGVQFHPESIATAHGHDILRNFLNLARIHTAPLAA
jgi:anthranilate/para-aminobenzoate synthase component II